MIRSLVLCASALLFMTSCAAFKDRRTPSGEFCSDMAVLPAGEEPDLEYHRLQPIQSDVKARTEAERLESLRKAACAVGGDAVIEAVNEEVRNEQAQYVLVSSGTAVIWVRPKTGGEVKPLTTHKRPKKDAAADSSAGPEASAPPPQPTAAPEPPAAVPTAAPTAAPVASASATATASAGPKAAPAKTASKLPTNAAPKPIGPKK